MSWWSETSVEGSCVFALDYKSFIKSNRVYFSDNSYSASIYPTSQGVYSSRTSGYDLKSLLTEERIFKSYSSINIRDAHLRVNTTTLPKEFTIILKAKINDTSTFMSSHGSYKGLSFTVSENSTSNLKWFFAGYVSEADTSFYSSKLLKDAIHTVVLKGNLTTQNASLITDFGTEIIPLSAFGSSNFLNLNRSFDTLGNDYRYSNNRPTADIIAYGLFSFEMSEEEVLSTLSKIEQETFLSSEEDDRTFKFKSSFGLKLKEEREVSSYSVDRMFFEVSEPLKPGITFIIDKHYTEIMKIHRLYKEHTKITDYVYEEDIPVITKLYLYERGTGQLIKTTTSDSKGYFEFKNLNKDLEYIVRASDKKYQFKSILKDYSIV